MTIDRRVMAEKVLGPGKTGLAFHAGRDGGLHPAAVAV
jgi:hypothetical protein